MSIATTSALAALSGNPVRGGLFIEPAAPDISLLFFAPPIPTNVSGIFSRVTTEWAGRKTKGQGVGGRSFYKQATPNGVWKRMHADILRTTSPKNISSSASL